MPPPQSSAECAGTAVAEGLASDVKVTPTDASELVAHMGQQSSSGVGHGAAGQCEDVMIASDSSGAHPLPECSHCSWLTHILDATSPQSIDLGSEQLEFIPLR